MLGNIFSVEGRVAVVTGGGNGLGRATCLGLAEYGADVAILDVNPAAAEAVAEEIRRDYGRKALALTADISKPAEVAAVMAQVHDDFGQIDILVNNAGVVDRKPVLEMDEASYDRVMNINVKGTYFCAKEAAKYMVPRAYGKIVNVASISSFRGLAERSVYCVSKGAVLQATRVMAVEWAPYHIHVNAVAPCYMDTPLTHSLYVDGQSFYEFIKRKTPWRPAVAKPEEVVGAILYLASDASEMATGTTISVDGGWTAD